MGWWSATRDGQSLQTEDTGIVWGDQPADLLSEALDSIVTEFQDAVGRLPTAGELRAGLEFALMGVDDATPFDRDTILFSD